MKVGKLTIKVVVGTLQIQDNTWVGKVSKGFYQYSIGLTFNIMLAKELQILM
jgi:hypothetical protein